MTPKFKHVGNFADNSDFVEMYLYAPIGGERGIDGQQFAYELNYLANYHEPRPKEIKVRINSPGGDMFQGISIFSAIQNANKAGKVVVNTYNDGVAASMGGIILFAGKNIYVKDYSRIMIHGVIPLDNDGNVVENLSEDDKTMLKNFEGIAVEMISGKTGIAESAVREYMTNGRDNWFSALEGAKLGFYPAKYRKNRVQLHPLCR